MFTLILAAALAAALEPAASQPALRPFASGVAIDWSQRAVRVDATVVLERGALEFLACFRGKEHESIVRFEAAAEHIFQALGLIGLTPVQAATQPSDARPGDLIEIDFEWRDAAGEVRRATANEWLRGVEYGRPPVVLNFVFQGSTALPNRTLTAGRTGEGVALVDFPDALIGVTRRSSSRSGELWLEANAARVPPAGTRVVVILRAAARRTPSIALDLRGTVLIDDEPARDAELADLLLVQRRLNPEFRATIRVVGALDADVDRLRRRLAALGVPSDALDFAR